MTVRISPRRQTARTAIRPPVAMPQFYDYYERISDGTVWQVRQVHRKDRQVRLERANGEHTYVFTPELASDYRPGVGL